MLTERQRALVVLALACLAVFASLGLGRFGFSMVWPAMQETLDLNATKGGELQSWNSLGYLLFVVVAGMLATRLGPRLVITVALALAGAAMLLTGAAPNFATLAVGRFLAGVGGAAANVPAMAMLGGWFSGKRRGLAAGCAVGGSSIGIAATGAAVPLILAAAAPAEGWRFCWFAYGGATLVVAALCAVFLRDPPDFAKPRAAAEADREGHVRTVLRAGLLWKIAAAYFAFGFSYSIYATFFVKHLIGGVGLEAARAGRVWMFIGILSIVSGFIWGAVSDRWGRRLALMAIFACQGAGFIAAGITWGVPGAIVSGALFALTAWSIPAVVSALCMDGFGTRLAPAAFGVATVVFGVGQVLGPRLAGMLADARHSLCPAFLVAGATAVILGIGASAFLPRTKREAGK